MRTTIAYYLLLLYAVALCRPAFPLLSDAMAHTFTEAVHLSTVHMVYGADHAVQEAAKENAADNKSSHTNWKSIEPIAVHLAQPIVAVPFFRASQPPLHGLFILQKIPSPALLLTTPPPDFLG